MKQQLEKIFGQMMHTKGLVIILLIGIGLLLLPGLFSGSEASKTAPEAETAVWDYSDYEEKLETRLAEILATISGVSQVSVMVTLEDSGEVYYARNETASEKDTEDSALRESSLQVEGSLALKNESGGGQSPVLLKSGMPRVSGVLVTAKGVENPATQASVVNAVRAVLDVAVHRVQVLAKS